MFKFNYLMNLFSLLLFQPLWWEYIWCISLLLSFLALSAVKRNRIKTLQKYMIGIILLGLGPLVYATVYYFKDVWTYLSVGKSEDIHLWQVITFFKLLNFLN